MNHVLAAAMALTFALSAMAAPADTDNRTYPLCKSLEVPVIDGLWDDGIWKEIEPTGNFIQTEPVEYAPPSFPTEVKIFYTDHAIYLAAMCYDPEPGSILRQLGTRDDELNADLFRIELDPYDAQQDYTAFWVTASGVQGDYKYSDPNFNAVWESAVAIHENGWSLELKIPYAALRLPRHNEQRWSIQMYRHIRRLNESVAWSPTRRENSNYMDFFGKLTGIGDLDPPVRLSLTPYMNMQLKSAPGETGEREFDWTLSGGADLKYGINESFTMDMTLLPDFSQVQSDDIINNLTAFETIFDEQRTFFQEGVDLFSLGNLFYSRRIGSEVLDPNAAERALEPGGEIVKEPEKSRLLNAFKVSGWTRKDLGIGVFNAIEGRSFAEVRSESGEVAEVQNDPLSNYNIAVIQKNFRNNRSVYGINTNVTRSNGFRNGNVTGAGFSANFADNKFNVRGSASYSVVNDKIDVEKRKTGYQYIFDFDRISGQWRYGWRTEGISENYDRNDLSYNFETNYLQHGWSTNYNVYQPMKRVNYLNTLLFLSFRQHMPTGELSGIWMEMTANTTFTRSQTRVWGRVNADLYGEKDFYEARTPGQIYRRPWQVTLVSGLATDKSRKLRATAEAYTTLSGDHGGWYVLGGFISPFWQANDHFSLGYTFEAARNFDDVGYATHSEGEPIFGKRDIREFNNVFSATYIIRNNLSLGLRARHYWSRVDYGNYYALMDDGNLTSTLYADPQGGNDINFNSFNIDVLFSWEFAPGSALSLSYKNSLLEAGNDLEGNLFTNLSRLFEEVQTNVVSLRLVYYLDYNTVREWAGRKRSGKAEIPQPESVSQARNGLTRI